MDRFEIGRSYGVMHLDDRQETVTIAGRDIASVTFEDGRRARVLHGLAPDGSDEEVLRIDERGAFAAGGVVRACHLRPNTEGQRAGTGPAGPQS
jgi:hypothetical protein